MTEKIEVSTGEDDLISLRAKNLELETALRDTQEVANRRLIDAELRHHALKNGMVDLDGLKLIDPVDVNVDETGTVKGAASVISKLQREKPWLFMSVNSSSLASAPPSTPARSKLATEMSLQEWRTARAELVRRR
jgi:hypothetical protein